VKPPFSIVLFLQAVRAKFTIKVDQTSSDFAPAALSGRTPAANRPAFHAILPRRNSAVPRRGNDSRARA
jgi:hypothetical protein